MACFHPLQAYRVIRDGSVVFKAPSSAYLPLSLPCGQCAGCRLERSRQWAVRCVHESKMHEQNCFVTLTYSDDNIPGDYSLRYTHFQLFMKRLRKHYGFPIRFYMCGEYGENTQRPHYHACLFGLDFPDKVLWKKSNSGNSLYRSPTLERLWGFGHCSVGELTFETAAYTARYIMKKRTGLGSDKHYRAVSPSTGEVHDRVPEFTRMSLKPGIGSSWYDKFGNTDVFPHDRVVVRGVAAAPPRYYRNKLQSDNPELSEALRLKRVRIANSSPDNSPERLAVREVVHKAKVALLKRSDF